jgi:hypothetical protein
MGKTKNIPKVVVRSFTSADSFAGMDSSKIHMAATPTASTQSVLIANDDITKQIVVWETMAATTPTNTATSPFVGTIAEEGSTEDLLVFIPNRLWNFLYSSPYRVSAGKDLVFHQVQANTGTASLNTIQLLYTLESV